MYIKYHLVSLFYKHLRHTYNHIIYIYYRSISIYVYVFLSMYANCQYFFPGPPAWRCRCYGVPCTVLLVDEQLSHQKDGKKDVKRGWDQETEVTLQFHFILYKILMGHIIGIIRDSNSTIAVQSSLELALNFVNQGL